jgi:hypothetical protein
MKPILDDVIENGKQFVRSHGRPLEKALLGYGFEDSPREAVIAALAAYQNDDGGFGKAFEPDLRYAGSSALCITEALSAAGRIGLDAEHPMVARAIGYLVDTYHADSKCWDFVPKEVDGFPRAPWWNYNPDARTARHNPRPEILGYFLNARAIVPQEVLKEVAADVEAAFLAEVESLQMHDLLCYLRLSRCGAVPESLNRALSAHLPGVIRRLTAVEPEKWAGYTVRPYQVVENLQDPFLPLVADALPAALEYLMNEQSEDGSWPLTWNWGDSFPAVWPQAERDWRSRVTFDNLRTLKNFMPMVSS